MLSGNAQESYLVYGDARPPLNTLLGIDAVLETQASPAVQAFRADVLTDCAVVRPEHADVFMNAASSALQWGANKLLMDANAPEITRLSVFSKSGSLSACLFKQTLTPVWQSAISDEPVRLDYPYMLSAASRLLPYVVNTYSGTAGYLVEFLPLLLLARASSGSSKTGTIGRLALARENRRKATRVGSSSNSNWDIGISMQASGMSFIEPDFKVQVKSAPVIYGQTKKFHAAGVEVLSADNHGFRDVASVVNGCLSEQALPMNVRSKVLPPARLDRMTAAIIDDMQQQAEAIAKLALRRA